MMKGAYSTRSIAGLAVALMAIALTNPSRAQNLVQNPGFELSTSRTSSPGWTEAGQDLTFFSNSQVNFPANTGLWSAAFGDTSAAAATADALTQSVPTTPMATYVVSFFLANLSGPHNTFNATFDGQTVLSLADAAPFGYTLFSATVTVRSSQSVLSFIAEQDPSYFTLDDISVEAAPALVPGGGVVSFCVFFAALGLRHLRRRRLSRSL